jgi:hypothetical protein
MPPYNDADSKINNPFMTCMLYTKSNLKIGESANQIIDDEGCMAEYKIYLLNGGRIERRHDFICDSLEQVCAEARRVRGLYDVEVWTGAKRVWKEAAALPALTIELKKDNKSNAV